VDRAKGTLGPEPARAALRQASSPEQPARQARWRRTARAGPDRAGGAAPARSPFERDGRLARGLPFAAVAALAELSLLLPPGVQSLTGLIVSLVLLTAAAAAVLLPWSRLPRWATVLVPLTYLGSVLALTIASGGANSGIEVVLIVPVVWTALFHRPWESGCVVAALAGAGILASFYPGEAPPATIVRRVLFLTAVAVMISVATHMLRARIRRSEAATARLQGRLRELSIAADRDRIAASLHDTVVQRLFAAGLSLQGAGQLSGQPDLSKRIDAVVQNLDDAIKLLRQSIFGLEHGLPAHGLRRGILDVSNELTPVLGTAPEVILDGPIDTAVPPPVASQLLAALREALTHSGSGAQATRVAVAVAASGGELTLTITDNGIRWGARMGGDGPRLSALRELARRMGGTLQVSPAADGDERLVWQVPLAAGGPPDPPPASAPGAA
jgi:signal transduction histidine kinase